MQPTITLRRGGVEYLHWRVTGLPAAVETDAVEASVDNGATWHPATVAAWAFGAVTLSLLVAHPAVVPTPPGAVVLRTGPVEVLVRLTDSPEVIIRPGGTITVEA